MLVAPWSAVAGFARRKPLGAIGGFIVLALVVTALLAPVLAPYDPRQIVREADNRVPVYAAPGLRYPMGTDHVGRDIVSRIVYALATFFDWLPPLGYATVWDDPLLNFQQLILPALTLAFNDLAFTARVTRSSMLEVMREDYLRTARAKGLGEMIVVARHALKNALLPVLTVSGYQFARLLGGVIIVESIFVVPGMGTLLIDSIVHRDFIVLQAIVLLVAAVVLVINLLVDLSYGVLDPRVRYQ